MAAILANCRGVKNSIKERPFEVILTILAIGKMP